MKKDEYLSMLIKDNITADGYRHEINEAIIDCVDIALSQMPSSFEIRDTSVGLAEFEELIAAEAEKEKDKIISKDKTVRRSLMVCCSPLRAAELIAEKLGAKFERASRRLGGAHSVKSLEDFL